MKRYRQLYDRIASFENLLLAFYKARKGKRSKDYVRAFEVNLERELFRLQEELQTETYQPGGYRTFHIYEPKERMISAAPFRDRVVHHALCNVIEPIFERSFIFDTYANRRGKGTHAAIRRCQAFARRYPYVLKADIRKYFPSIDHQVLKDRLTRKIGCAATLRLIDAIIDNSNPQEPVWDIFPGDDLFSSAERRKGLPMGNLTSQFFANVYLDGLDHFVKETLRAPAYIRYVDDFVLFGSDKQALWAQKEAIGDFLSTSLRLRLHPKKTHVFPVSCGISFLGQQIYTTHRLLRSANVRRFYHRLKGRLREYHLGALSPEKMECQLNAWLGHARQAQTYGLRKAVFRKLKHEERVGVWPSQRKEEVWVVL